MRRSPRCLFGFDLYHFNPRKAKLKALAQLHFNPRTLQESATHEFGHVVDATTISIHTPYKRVRQIVDTSNVDNYVFQSTHPTRECDKKGKGTKHYERDFNPRTLQESATRLTWVSRSGTRYFNPRTLQESATTHEQSKAAIAIFQSTHPTRECDLKSLKRQQLLNNFNPRTLQESATFIDHRFTKINNHFNPRTLQESAT